MVVNGTPADALDLMTMALATEGSPADDFFPEIQAGVEASEAVHKDYTAARLAKFQPVKFKAVVHYLAAGHGLLRIAKLVGVSHHTVAAVRDLYPHPVAIERERLAKLCLRGAELCIERVVNEVESMPKQTLGLTAAQLIDKYQLLTGGATARIEQRPADVPTHEAFNDLIDALPQAKAHVMPAGTGLSGGESGPKAADLEAGSEGPSESATDISSLVFQSAGEVATHPATHSTADAGPAAEREQGAGGGRESAGGSIHTTDSATRKF